VQNIWPNATKTVCTKYKVGKLGSVALLIIIWQTYDQAFSSSALKTMKTSNVVFLVFMSTGLFAFFLVLAFFTSKIFFNKADTVAICYCVPAKTPASKSPN
jgi:sodium/bile acid cotransporter 7